MKLHPYIYGYLDAYGYGNASHEGRYERHPDPVEGPGVARFDRLTMPFAT